MNKQFDLNFRPDTYWPDELNQEQLLARIAGQVRRDIARQVLAEDGNAGLDAIAANEVISASDRFNWGLQHPSCMGGEYLPQLGDDDVEIARISLNSTTSDQFSIRVSRAEGKICYAVYDEYESEFELAVTESEQPLTLGELIAFIDSSSDPKDEQPGGLLVSHWEWDLYCGESSPEQAVSFAWVQSAWYPELAAYYEGVGEEWCAAKRKARPDLYEEDEEEVYA